MKMFSMKVSLSQTQQQDLFFQLAVALLLVKITLFTSWNTKMEIACQPTAKGQSILSEQPTVDTYNDIIMVWSFI